jgi:hypothetical protein
VSTLCVSQINDAKFLENKMPLLESISFSKMPHGILHSVSALKKSWRFLHILYSTY